MPVVTFEQNFFTDDLKERSTSLWQKAGASLQDLKDGNCLGADLAGWYDYPEKGGYQEAKDISDFVKNLEVDYDTVVVVGIGGSYLGTRAIADSLNHSYLGQVPAHLAGYKKQLIYAGHHLSEAQTLEILDLLGNRLPIINVISKSGGTTEPGVAFRVLRRYLEERFGTEGAKDRILVTTGQEKGALRQLAFENSYKTFDVPSEVGGRYSVLTPVGVLPLALAGFNVEKLMAGAGEVFRELKEPFDEENPHPALCYAAARLAAYHDGKKVELLAYSDPKLRFFVEWWKQLFGESEGKDGKGLFPSGVSYTTDLHSIGQMMQAGERILLETFLTFEENSSSQMTERRLKIPEAKENLDGLGYIENRFIADIDAAAIKATKLAHFDGGVPCLEVKVKEKNEAALGALMAFFEVACAVSGAMLGVNPFDQPGVENYKENLCALLGKPGYEQLNFELRKRF